MSTALPRMVARPRALAAASSAVALVLLLIAGPRAAVAAPATYQVGSVPVAPAVLSFEFPVHRPFAAQLDASALGQGTYDDHNPFEYLSLLGFSAWLHYDGVRNLRLSAAFQEIVNRSVRSLGIPSGHEERGLVRARLQQPRGTAAPYEMLQLEVRSFDDPRGPHRVVFRPRFRFGLGLNLDAKRIHSLVTYQEVAFRYCADEDYAARAFDFFRAFAGYMWTTRRGTFVTLGAVGQVALNPAATRYDFLWGPALVVAYRFGLKGPETPPAPPEVELQ